MEQVMQNFTEEAPLWFDQILQTFSLSFEPLSELSAGLNLYILLPIFFVVTALLIGYFKNYQWPAARLNKTLSALVSQIKASRFNPELSPEQLKREIDSIFSLSSLRGLWTEYSGSLHVVQTRKEGVEKKTILATMPAEMFFSKESVVDLEINADFYRHLPGILTGIGIIGTFSGLVWGLHEFKPDTTAALSSLPLLLQEITSAFIGSGFAILAAIFVTYKEKSILNRCYRLVEELNKEIDSLYATGVGEEYLARLVQVSESNPAATINDLSKLMHDITERQIQAQERQNQMLSQHVAAAVKDALSAPMQELSTSVREVTQNQSQAVSRSLETLLQAFIARLDHMFGQQITEINASLRQSSEIVSQVQEAMQHLIGDIGQAGTSAVEQMSGRLNDSMARTAEAQEQVNEQIRTFMEELRVLLFQQQTQSADIMDVTMRAVLTKLQSALNNLSHERAQQIEQDMMRHEALSSSVGRLIEAVETANISTAQLRRAG